MAKAGSYDFEEYQGDTWDESFQITDAGVPRNLSGYTARMYLKALITNPDPPVFALTTTNGRLVITAGTGTITFNVTPTESDAITAATYVYDLELVVTATGKVKKYIQGNFKVNAQVTTGT
jgi:hypothetical protein